MLVEGQVGVENGLGFKEFIFNHVRQSFFPVDVVFVLLFSCVEVSHQSIQFPLPLPNDALDIFILDSVLFNRFVDVVDVGRELGLLLALFL
jgi:hypothetical protein